MSPGRGLRFPRRVAQHWTFVECGQSGQDGDPSTNPGAPRGHAIATIPDVWPGDARGYGPGSLRRTGRQARRPLLRVSRIAVIGGGPAGLMAAETLAGSGATVRL